MTEYAFDIKNSFDRNPYIEKDIESNRFIWIRSNKKENVGLEINIYLKDSAGNIVDIVPEGLKLSIELVYADGFPAPTYALNHECLRQLLNSLTHRTQFDAGCKATFVFQFRIEDVSYHHPHREGFKLKVSAPGSLLGIIHFGLSDTIFVVSKMNPKKTSTPILNQNVFKKRRASCPENILRGTSFITSGIEASFDEHDEKFTQSPKHRRKRHSLKVGNELQSLKSLNSSDETGWYDRAMLKPGGEQN